MGQGQLQTTQLRFYDNRSEAVRSLRPAGTCLSTPSVRWVPFDYLRYCNASHLAFVMSTLSTAFSFFFPLSTSGTCYVLPHAQCRHMFAVPHTFTPLLQVQAGTSEAGGAGVPSMQERQALFKEDP